MMNVKFLHLSLILVAVSTSAFGYTVPKATAERAIELAKIRYGVSTEIKTITPAPMLPGLEDATQVFIRKQGGQHSSFIMLADGKHILEASPLNVLVTSEIQRPGSVKGDQELQTISTRMDATAREQPVSQAALHIPGQTVQQENEATRKTTKNTRDFRLRADIFETDKLTPSEFVQRLSTLYAIEQGNGDGRNIVNVFYDPECPNCVDEFRGAQQHLQEGIRFRWIPIPQVSAKPYNQLLHLLTDEGSPEMMKEQVAGLFNRRTSSLSEDQLLKAIDRLATNEQLFGQIKFKERKTPSAFYFDQHGNPKMITGYSSLIFEFLREDLGI